MNTITLDELQNNLADFIKRVREGETLLIMQADRPIAELKPIRENLQNRRPFGLCKDEFVTPDDFDAPLPLSILAEFEGE